MVLEKIKKVVDSYDTKKEFYLVKAENGEGWLCRAERIKGVKREKRESKVNIWKSRFLELRKKAKAAKENL